MDLFGVMVVILNFVVSNSYYGMPRWKISMCLPCEDPITVASQLPQALNFIGEDRVAALLL